VTVSREPVAESVQFLERFLEIVPANFDPAIAFQVRP
jgi:hypothetical protein